MALPYLEPKLPQNTIYSVFSEQAKELLAKKNAVKLGRKERNVLMEVTCGAGQEGTRLWESFASPQR